MLNEVPGLSDVVVNLMGNSMTLTAINKDLVDRVVEHVEDIGYEAHLVEAKSASAPEEEETLDRTIDIKVDGMFCEYVL